MINWLWLLQECSTLTSGVLESGKKFWLTTGCRQWNKMVYELSCSAVTERGEMNSGLRCWRRHTPSQSAALTVMLSLVLSSVCAQESRHHTTKAARTELDEKVVQQWCSPMCRLTVNKMIVRWSGDRRHRRPGYIPRPDQQRSLGLEFLLYFKDYRQLEAETANYAV